MLAHKSLVVCLFGALLAAGAALPVAGQTRSGPLDSGIHDINVDRLSNGLRVIQLSYPSEVAELGNRTEISFGYTVGRRNEPGYPAGVADLTRFYLAASIAARSVALVAHLGGGQFEFIDEPDRIGMRVHVADGLVETVLAQVRAYFAVPDFDPSMFEYARRQLRADVISERDEFGFELQRAVGAALLRDYPYLWSGPASGDQVDQLRLNDLETYFAENFGMDRAYVIVAESVPQSALRVLREINPRQTSRHHPATPPLPEPVEAEVDLPSRVQGGVVLASAVPSVHFEAWFRALAVDRMLQQRVARPADFKFGVALDPVLSWIEIPVVVPDFAEDVRDELLDEIIAMQSRNPDAGQLRRAAQSAMAYLKRPRVLEWFAAHDLWGPLEAGLAVISGLTPDGFRSAVRDFSSLASVVATWPAAFDQPRVTVESLSEEIATAPLPSPPLGRAPGRVPIPSLEAAAFPVPLPVQVERLDSGITLAEDQSYGIFVAGRFDGVLPGGEVRVGTNGSYWSFTDPPNDAVFDRLTDVRPDRVLVFATRSDLPTFRRRLNAWTGGSRDSTINLAVGQVATGDIPSLVVLKTWLDAKIIEAGWWGQVDSRIEGIEGSRLTITANDEQDSEVRAWIRELAESGLEQEEFLLVRKASLGYFDRIRRELKIFLSQRDPRGTIQLPTTVTQARLKDVARIYF